MLFAIMPSGRAQRDVMKAFSMAGALLMEASFWSRLAWTVHFTCASEEKRLEMASVSLMVTFGGVEVWLDRCQRAHR
jgi:hypothetical protein